MNAITVIQNGLVINPKSKTIEKRDVIIKNGKFTHEIDVKTLNNEENVTYIDAKRQYVSPGFIDLHVHVFPDANALGISPDIVGVYQGVTTVVDAGSSGVTHYEDFHNRVISKSKTRILSFLNLSRNGLCEGLSELANPDGYMTKEEFEEALATYESVIGLKVRLSRSVVKEQGNKPLEYLKDVFKDTDLPTMVHVGNAPPTLEEVLPLLDKGDIVTHAFHGKVGGIFSEDGNLIPEATDALQRGVIFDVGHGTDSFSFETMKKFSESEKVDFTISTDIYKRNYKHPVQSLAVTMTKLLEVGYSLEDVIAYGTILPAQAIHQKNLGTFDDGATGDVTIFTLASEEVTLTDSNNIEKLAKQVIVPVVTIKEGVVIMNNEKKDFHLTEEMNTLFEKSGEPFACESAFYVALQGALNIEIDFTDSQKLSLSSHISAMVNRSREGGTLPAFDKAMFADVPQECLESAREVVVHIGNLPDEETYLLSIHFAGAKMSF